MKTDVLKCRFCGEDDAKELEFDLAKSMLTCRRCGHSVIIQNAPKYSKDVEDIRAKLNLAISQWDDDSIEFEGSDVGAFDIAEGKLMKYRGNSTRVVVPYGVKMICSDAFAGCKTVKEVALPNSVTSIGGFAFKGCSNLVSVSIPSSVTSIGGCAFKGCSSLASIIIPGSVSSMGVNVFMGCKNLIIGCEACAKPSGWDSAWNMGKLPVAWGFVKD